MAAERSLEQAYTEKINLLRVVADETENLRSAHDTELNPELLSGKLEQIPKSLDILEICSGEVLGKMGKLLSSQNYPDEQSQTTGDNESNNFWDQQEEKALVFVGMLEELTRDGNPDSVASFLSANRKMISFCTDFGTLQRLGQTLSDLYVKGLLEKDTISIAHYPGSFNPFPHIGHAEVAEQVVGSMSLANLESPRVVVTTVTKTESKSIENNFSERVDSLIRGFADLRDVSVLGVASDLTKQEDVIDFRKLLAKLDAKGKTRHIMGSDTLASRIAGAREGDLLSNYLINSGATIFLSVRTVDEYVEVLDAINAINNEFDSQLIILPDPKYHISSTMVRALHKDMQQQFFASMHIGPGNL